LKVDDVSLCLAQKDEKPDFKQQKCNFTYFEDYRFSEFVLQTFQEMSYLCGVVSCAQQLFIYEYS